VTTLSLVPAGTHRGRAVADVLIDAKRSGMSVEDVVVDPGYSLLTANTMHDKLAAAGIHQTCQLGTFQRGQRPFSGNARLIDGMLFSSLLPDDLVDIPTPPMGSPESTKVEYETSFNQRARWRMSRHAGPDADGATRWRCPFCKGLLRSRRFPKTMRRGAGCPLVPVAEDVGTCCSGILTAMPAELALWQKIPFGTIAWRLSMGRRQLVESANASLKGGFVDLSRGFFRIFGVTTVTVMLSFAVAGFNWDRVRSFRAKHRLQDPYEPVDYPPVPMTRARRRKGTWADLVNERAKGPPSPS
jgi:hypothetical protein